jgi:hypothetical protein
MKGVHGASAARQPAPRHAVAAIPTALSAWYCPSSWLSPEKGNCLYPAVRRRFCNAVRARRTVFRESCTRRSQRHRQLRLIETKVPIDAIPGRKGSSRAPRPALIPFPCAALRRCTQIWVGAQFLAQSARCSRIRGSRIAQVGPAALGKGRPRSAPLACNERPPPFAAARSPSPQRSTAWAAAPLAAARRTARGCRPA